MAEGFNSVDSDDNLQHVRIKRQASNSLHVHIMIAYKCHCDRCFNFRKRKLPAGGRSAQIQNHGPVHCELEAAVDSSSAAVSIDVEPESSKHVQGTSRDTSQPPRSTGYSHVDHEDLLLGLCPEDVMSTSFCISTDDCLTGHEKETVTPNMQSPNKPSPSPSPKLLNSHTKSSVDQQCTVVENVAHLVSPPSVNCEPVRTKFIFPPDTFYGLPMKVKMCIEENRGISSLYGNTIPSECGECI